MAKDTKTSAKSSGDSRLSARKDKASGADPVASSGDETAADKSAADEEAAGAAADKSAAAEAAAAEAAAAEAAAADKAAADKAAEAAAADKAAAEAAADKAAADKAAADKAAAEAAEIAEPPATAAAAAGPEPATLLRPELIDRSIAPSTPAPPPGVAPAGDARSLRRTRDGTAEFCLIYRLRSLLIRRQGVVGTMGEWTITDYPSLGSASHAYAQECSDLTGDGFIDIRG
jgi:hypothetical protein